MQPERFSDEEIDGWLGQGVRGDGQQGEVVGVCQHEHDHLEDGWLLLVAWRRRGAFLRTATQYSALDRTALARMRPPTNRARHHGITGR